MTKKTIHQVVLTVRVDIEKDADIDMEDVINELEYQFKDTTEKATVVDTVICGFEEN